MLKKMRTKNVETTMMMMNQQLCHALRVNSHKALHGMALKELILVDCDWIKVYLVTERKENVVLENQKFKTRAKKKKIICQVLCVHTVDQLYV